jgi:hypothetical protein
VADVVGPLESDGLGSLDVGPLEPDGLGSLDVGPPEPDGLGLLDVGPAEGDGFGVPDAGGRAEPDGRGVLDGIDAPGAVDPPADSLRPVAGPEAPFGHVPGTGAYAQPGHGVDPRWAPGAEWPGADVAD